MKQLGIKGYAGKAGITRFGLSVIGLLALTTASFAASPAPDCSAVVSTDNVTIQYPSSSSTLALGAVSVGFSGVNPEMLGPHHQICFTLTIPDANDAACEGPTPFIIPDNTQFYVHMVNTNADTRCTYAVTLNSATTVHSASVVNLVRSTVVPIFTPLGLIATLGGLLWFGRRRKAKV